MKGYDLSQFLKSIRKLVAAGISPDYSTAAEIKQGFDENWYTSQYPEVLRSGMAPILHFVKVGSRDGLNPNPYFDTLWYLTKNKDVAKTGINPLKHYLYFGALEGRDPSPRFSTNAYIRRYHDVAASRQNPLVHFLKHGLQEGRSAHDPDDLWHRIETSMQMLMDDASQPPPNHILFMGMQQHIEPDGRPYGYRSTGSDPQLYIDTKVPAGFFRLRLKITYSGIPRSLAEYSSLQLFVGDEKGFRPGNVWTYSIHNQLININDLLFNATDINCFRLDPLDTLGNLIIERFEITPLPLHLALKEVLALCRTTRVGMVEAATDMHSLFTKEHILDLVKSLSSSEPDSGDPYQHWISQRVMTSAERTRFVGLVSKMKTRPSFSILMPTYKSDIKLLDRAITSIHEQVYPNWELCIVDDGSGIPELRAFVEGWARRDRRIKFKGQLKNAGISAATNVALKMATGVFVALIDHDDEIAPHALYAVAVEINRYEDADMLYTDEDKMDVSGNRFGPLFKPDWSPEFFLGCMYTCHLGVYRRSLVEKVGGFRSEFDLAQDYDLALRVSVEARRIVHIPDVLYHWRITEHSTAGGADGKPTAELAARRAVQSAIDAAGLAAQVVEGPFRGSHRVRLDLIRHPLISIVIPTAGRRVEADLERWYLLDLLESLKHSTYCNFEIIIVHNGDMEQNLCIAIDRPEVRLVHYRSDVFNIADKLNLGVDAAAGEFVVILNDDMTILTEGWLEEMLMWFQREGVVGVGAKLLFPNNTVQHAGVILLAQGPSHIYYGADRSELGLAGAAVIARNYSAVTGACMMVRRADYLKCGGFDPFFRVNYNDVDFCLRLGKLGRIVYEPNAVLYHYESVSKDESPLDELTAFNERWDSIVGKDPYYNRNLSQRSSTNEITSRPRTLKQDYP